MIIKKCTVHPLSLFDEIFDDLIKINSNDIEFKNPIHDIIINDTEYIVELHLPGISKENINLDVDTNELIITAERKLPENIKYYRKQSYFGKYKRNFTLPDDVDKDKINATFSDGILIVKIPKNDLSKSNKTKIQIN